MTTNLISNCNQLTFFCCVQVCCIVPLRSDVGLVELKGAAYLMSSPMVALVVRELVMLMYNQRLNERGAVSWDLDYLHSANATKSINWIKSFKDFCITVYMHRCLSMFTTKCKGGKIHYQPELNTFKRYEGWGGKGRYTVNNIKWKVNVSLKYHKINQVTTHKVHNRTINNFYGTWPPL